MDDDIGAARPPLNYLARMRHRIDGREAGVPGDLVPRARGDVGEKTTVLDFATMLGVRTARQLWRGNLQELTSFPLPPRCVVKPAFASTSIGVYLLERRDEAFHDFMSSRSLSFDELLKELQAVEERYEVPAGTGTFLVEEALSDREDRTPPPDVRCYMFQGVAGLIMMEDHTVEPLSVSYFDGDFSPISNVHEKYGIHEKVAHLERIVDTPVPPAGAAEILAVARRVSIAVPTAFCRVDLYDTAGLPTLGEITLYPGTFYYQNRKLMSESEAQRLGVLWAEAERRLAGSALRPAPNPD